MGEQQAITRLLVTIASQKTPPCPHCKVSQEIYSDPVNPAKKGLQSKVSIDVCGSGDRSHLTNRLNLSLSQASSGGEAAPNKQCQEGGNLPTMNAAMLPLTDCS